MESIKKKSSKLNKRLKRKIKRLNVKAIDKAFKIIKKFNLIANLNS